MGVERWPRLPKTANMMMLNKSIRNEETEKRINLVCAFKNSFSTASALSMSLSETVAPYPSPNSVLSAIVSCKLEPIMV